jgi:hypothetical protein
MMKVFDKMREDSVPSDPKQPTAEQLQSRMSTWKQACKLPAFHVSMWLTCAVMTTSLCRHSATALA